LAGQREEAQERCGQQREARDFTYHRLTVTRSTGGLHIDRSSLSRSPQPRVR
jgi:hypothetical protein